MTITRLPATSEPIWVGGVVVVVGDSVDVVLRTTVGSVGGNAPTDTCESLVGAD